MFETSMYGQSFSVTDNYSVCATISFAQLYFKTFKMQTIIFFPVMHISKVMSHCYLYDGVIGHHHNIFDTLRVSQRYVKS